MTLITQAIHYMIITRPKLKPKHKPMKDPNEDEGQEQSGNSQVTPGED